MNNIYIYFVYYSAYNVVAIVRLFVKLVYILILIVKQKKKYTGPSFGIFFGIP